MSKLESKLLTPTELVVKQQEQIDKWVSNLRQQMIKNPFSDFWIIILRHSNNNDKLIPKLVNKLQEEYQDYDVEMSENAHVEETTIKVWQKGKMIKEAKKENRQIFWELLRGFVITASIAAFLFLITRG